ncbi:MAG TPA: biotin/lipoyl-containing protein, partial [Acetobacteraceae bacterium]|nr:biotin/lipoyl-containing protein [Acetobacteraceae bacterium]
MATNILMPALSPTMTEGTLSRWLKKEGENVRAGDVIAEIETDKATMEVEAVDEGVLGKILVTDGTEGVKVNEPIAILVDQGEAVPASAPAAKPAPTPAPPSAPAPEPVAKAESPRPAPPSGNGHDTGGERIFVSPLARRMAKQAGLELTALKGSGPNGRIVKADIEAALQKGAPPAPPPAAAPAAAPVARPSGPIAAPHTLVPHSSIRRVIARR